MSAIKPATGPQAQYRWPSGVRILTNTDSGTLQFLEARHRAHARVEDRIRHAKDSGLGRFPSREFSINQTWLTLTMIAADLVAWFKMLALDGDLAKAEPKALR